MCSKFSEMQIPDTVDFTKGLENLINHKEWIFAWNLSYFSNPENNIDSNIYSLEKELEESIKVNMEMHIYSDYIEIVKFRLNILKEVRAHLNVM
jgi:hypothetical protein